MPKQKKLIIIGLVISALITFCLFAIPNSKASENRAMVGMFEPDEEVMLPVIHNMIQPQQSLRMQVYNFIGYDFYSYGFLHFAPSAILLLALNKLGLGNNMPVLMLVLRQMISVLPMLLAIGLLVYMHDGFNSYRSIVLFILLVSVPAVTRNAFWWHPDGQVLLLASLVLFFLWKDERRFGVHFYIAAALCGALTALKLVGVFFFLAVALCILWAVIEKKISWVKALQVGELFVLCMALAYVACNPYLLLRSKRPMVLGIIKREFAETAHGYGVIYPKGLRASWPIMHRYYGLAPFILLAIGLSIRALWSKEKQFLHALLLAWFLPLSLYLLLFSHFKYQYWLPVGLPCLSSIVLLFPTEKPIFNQKSIWNYLQAGALLLIAIQWLLFVSQDAQMIQRQKHRAEKEPAILFYDLALKQLKPVKGPLSVYYDYRLYVPGEEDWTLHNSFDLLNYKFIRDNNFDLLFLSRQRIRDYLQDGLQSSDPQALEQSRVFYRDARDGTIEGYRLLFRNKTGLLYIRAETCLNFYSPEFCRQGAH